MAGMSHHFLCLLSPSFIPVFLYIVSVLKRGAQLYVQSLFSFSISLPFLDPLSNFRRYDFLSPLLLPIYLLLNGSTYFLICYYVLSTFHRHYLRTIKVCSVIFYLITDIIFAHFCWLAFCELRSSMWCKWRDASNDFEKIGLKSSHFSYVCLWSIAKQFLWSRYLNFWFCMWLFPFVLF